MPYQITERIALGSAGGPRHARQSTARRAARVAAALGKLTIKRRPRWAAKAMAVAVIIPGWVDEILLGAGIAVYVWSTHRAEFAAVARSTWNA